MSASPFTAEDAERWGMVSRLWQPDKLMAGVLGVAEAIAANGPVAVRQAKRAISLGAETDLKTGLAIVIEAYNRTVPSDDRCEGVLAFNEKRQPQFRGR